MMEKEFEREAWLAVREAVLAGGNYRGVAKYYGLQYKLSGAEMAVSCATPKRPGLLADALLWMANDVAGVVPIDRRARK